MRQSQRCNYGGVAVTNGHTGPHPGPHRDHIPDHISDHTAGGSSHMYEAFQSESGPGDHGWQDDANCLGVAPDLFFPERGASTREAKEVCRGCVVREECLEYALVNGEKFGIWGGMSERERRRIRRQRALAGRAAAGATA